MFNGSRNNGFETVDDNINARKVESAIKKVFSTLAVIVIALILIFGSTYQIKEQEQAVLITFGKAKAVTSPGLILKSPLSSQSKKSIPPFRDFPLAILLTAMNIPKMNP